MNTNISINDPIATNTYAMKWIKNCDDTGIEESNTKIEFVDGTKLEVDLDVNGAQVKTVVTLADKHDVNIKQCAFTDDVLAIGHSSFDRCEEITSISGLGLTTMEDDAFYGCQKLSSIELSAMQFETLTSTIGNGAFDYCFDNRCRQICILSSIGNEGCMLSIVNDDNIIDSTIDVRTKVYESDGTIHTTLLSDIIFSPYGPTFSQNTEVNGDLIIDIGLMNNGKLDFLTNTIHLTSYSNYISVCNSLSTIFEIENYSFFDAQRIVDVDLPCVKHVGIESFYYCNNLTSVSLPQATTIEERAFQQCSHLTSISLPQATIIGVGAFQDCSQLVSISLPRVTAIGPNTFEGCNELRQLELLMLDESYIKSNLSKWGFTDWSSSNDYYRQHACEIYAKDSTFTIYVY